MLRCILIGFLLGGFLGVIIPIAWWWIFVALHGDGGVGTGFALMMVFTVPGGMGLGTIFGAMFGLFSE